MKCVHIHGAERKSRYASNETALSAALVERLSAQAGL